MSAFISFLTLISPALKYIFDWLVNKGKTSDEAKKNLEEAYQVIVDKRRKDISKIKRLEERLDKEHKKMDDIRAGRRKFAWQKDKENADEKSTNK